MTYTTILNGPFTRTMAKPSLYLAESVRGDGRPVLVLHAWWGLNDDIKHLCDRLAEAGFVACAPDLYGGPTADSISDAEVLANQLEEGRARAAIKDAVAILHQHADPVESPLAIIAFSLGVWFALELSETQPETFDRVVVYYGTRPGEYKSSRAAYLGHFAESDEFEPQEAVDDLRTSLEKSGKTVTFHYYPATGHWFAEPGRPDAYDPEAAALAWQRTLNFLQQKS